jgi:simple sugar transport system permease protein
VTLGIAVAAMAATLALMDIAAQDALLALWRGTFGTTHAITSTTLVRAVPLVLTGLAVALAFRAGVFNIGAEGQLLAGAGAAAAVASIASTGVVALPLMLAAGMAAGGAWAGVAAWLRHRFGVLEVISTILLNFVALHLVGFLVRGPLQEPTGIYPQTPMLEPAARLPVLIPGTRLHAGAAIALVAAVAMWWVLRETAAGFRVRVAGANPDAAATAGEVNVAAVTMRAFLVSGALAGLAGAVELTGVTYALYENLSPGYGYTAIAVALLARLHPLGVLAAGLLFGGLEAGASAMQRDAGVPAALVHALTAVAILGVLAATRPRRSA